jgi:hypothetical protein
LSAASSDSHAKRKAGAPASSLLLFFDFTGATGNRYPIHVGDTVGDGVPAAGAGNIEQPSGIDIYTFNATPGQRVYFEELTGDCNSTTKWNLTDPAGAKVFDQTLGGGDTTTCGNDAGRFQLAGGCYMLIVTSNAPATYSFKLLDVPPPDQFAIAIGQQ